MAGFGDRGSPGDSARMSILRPGAVSLLAEGTRAASGSSFGSYISLLLNSLLSLDGWVRGTGLSSPAMAGCLKSVGVVGMLAAAYMAVSTGMLAFNKYWMHEDRFPFAAVLGLIHMVCSFGFNAVLFIIRPDLYPSMSNASQIIDKALVVRVLLPIACSFAAQLVLSNMAFMHSSVAFLQMMKQSNVVLVYCFSLALSLERFSWMRGAVLVLIVGSTALTVHGELNFSQVGFAIQSCSMVCESIKLTLQSYSLSSSGHRLDPLTYVMLVAPIVLLVLGGVVLMLHVALPDAVPEALSLPPWERVVEYRWLLIANGCLAFAMNVVHALFIKSSSAITFILTGVVMKDVVIVSVASALLGELLSSTQIVGFILQLIGILAWSIIKMSPSFLAAASRSSPDSRASSNGEGPGSVQLGPLLPGLASTRLTTARAVPSGRGRRGSGECGGYEELTPLQPDRAEQGEVGQNGSAASKRTLGRTDNLKEPQCEQQPSHPGISSVSSESTMVPSDIESCGSWNRDGVDSPIRVVPNRTV